MMNFRGRMKINNRKSNNRPAMTLVELIVSVAIMIMIIAGVGYVFSSTAKTVRTSRTSAEINTSARSFALQIRQDLQMLDREGFMAITGGGENSNGHMVPPVFMFTANGLFKPLRTVQDGPGSGINYDQTVANKATNSAIIMYMPVSSDDGSSVLMRFVYRLVGRTDLYDSGNPPRAYLFGSQMMTHVGNESFSSAIEAMVFGDYIFAGLGDINGLRAFDRNQTLNRPFDREISIFEGVVHPILRMFDTSSDPIEVNINPDTIPEVADLWPYFMGGLEAGREAFSVDFFDGYDENLDPWDIDEPLNKLIDPNNSSYEYDPLTTREDSDPDAWMNVNIDIDDSNQTKAFSDMASKRMGGSIMNHFYSSRICFGSYNNKYPFAIWTGRDQEAWPKMLRFRLKQGDVAGLANEAKDFEFIIPLR